ncbi:MFS transporter [Chelatococcus asaccharovorans]|uniref:DHA1 family inner membrane transport protein n=1 Tax=Chelatococcus asaccharovorans TaxID=28210 RepID=A0A2V3TS61_9HYPH|nr:MFS transporter [Chelatococcus asaccharovorans]MBS7703119.1 MFS transporter [Chelatococcus asaccharovorans]PXW50742.1 DHA1 family inner membrane transport protein [Chelatococcus asaccharovorans]
MTVQSETAVSAAAPSSRLPLFALATASFGIGTTEFVIMGLLPDVASDLGVTIPRAGLLITGYALSVTFGSPFLAIATARMDRRHALMLLMAVFILGNLLCAVSPNYALLMVARVVTALCHGAFFGLGAVVAAALVAPRKRAQAIAMMFAGLTLANVLGVPLGTALGGQFGWRNAFYAVALIGVVAALALQLWLPRTIPVPPMNLRREGGSLRSAQVILAMAISVAVSASMFSVFTYIAPILTTVTQVSARGVTVMLLLFGIGLTVGNVIGGRLADWRLMPSILGALAVLIPLLALFTVTSLSPMLTGVTLVLWGLVAFALVPPLQTRVVTEAAGAPNLASTLNQGAFNLGNAIGAWLGGVGLTLGLPYQMLPWMGSALALVALVLALISHRLALAGRVTMQPAL